MTRDNSDIKGPLIRLAVMLASVILVAEAAAFAGFKFYATDRLAAHWRVESSVALSELTPAVIERYQKQFYDPVLGWVFHEQTTALSYAQFDETGARVDSFAGPAGKFAAYGDSFTFGEDVGNGETWPHFLAEAVGVQVSNYGVAGYGPDQALLRLKGHLEKGRVPEVVILGVLSENISRVVNVWRPAYTGGETLNFKPILWIEGDAPRWVPNPLGLPISADAVGKAIEASRPYDFWLDDNQQRPVKPHFPYLLSALDALEYLAFRVVRWQDLWREDQPVAVFRALIDEFVDLSSKHKFRPVLVMIPMAEDLRFREAGNPPTYAMAVTSIRQQYQGRLTVVDTLDEPFDESKFQLRPFSGHASPYGNRAIASALFRNLSPRNPRD